MRISTRFLAIVAASSAVALAACGGSTGVSPVAATTTASDEEAVLTSSGYGPGYGYALGPGAGEGLCGDACTGPVGPDPDDVGTMLVDALQEEYRAEMLYRSVLEDFPGAMPFAVIAESEARHVAALQMLFTRRLMSPPASVWAPGSFEAFASVPAACAAGVQAETEDAAFYTPYLQRDDLPQDIRNVFTNLQAASLGNHLPAFERCR